MKKFILLLLLVPALSFASALKTDKQKLSYTLGHTVGQQLSREKYTFNVNLLIEGMDDAIHAKKPKLSQEQMKKALDTVKTSPVTTKSTSKGLKSNQNKVSYTIGTIIGQQIKTGPYKLENATLFSAIGDVLNHKKSRLTDEQMKTIMKNLQSKQEKQRKLSADKNLKAGQDFMKSNAKKKGIVTLPSGIQYKIKTKGDGKTHPNSSSTVEVHYEGTLIDGTIFDSSYKRGQTISFPLTGVIKGWTETIPLMTKGATWIIYIPANMAYGTNGAGASIGPNSTLIFKVNLINIK